MNSNKLKLNTDKTEVMPVGSASRVALGESECANIGENSVLFFFFFFFNFFIIQINEIYNAMNVRSSTSLKLI